MSLKEVVENGILPNYVLVANDGSAMFYDWCYSKATAYELYKAYKLEGMPVVVFTVSGVLVYG